MIWTVGLILLFTALGAINNNSSTGKPKPTPTVTVTVTPSPTSAGVQK